MEIQLNIGPSYALTEKVLDGFWFSINEQKMLNSGNKSVYHAEVIWKQQRINLGMFSSVKLAITQSLEILAENRIADALKSVTPHQGFIQVMQHQIQSTS